MMTLVLVLGSTLPGVRSASPQIASAYAPPPPTVPAPTSSSVEPDQAVQSLPTLPAPDDLPPEVEETRARQAIEAMLEKYPRYWGPRYQVAPVEVKVEGEWAHGVAQWESQARTLEGPIHILAHRSTDDSWQALMPGSDGMYLQLLEAVPESLVSVGEKGQLHMQVIQADDLRQSQPAPAIPPVATAIPPSKEIQNGLYGLQYVPISVSISSSVTSEALIMYVDAGQIHIHDLETSSDQVIGPEFGDILSFTVVNRADFYSKDDITQVVVDPGYTLVHGIRSPDRQQAVYLEAICEQNRCTPQFRLWLTNSNQKQRQLLLSSENSPHPGFLFNPIGWSVTRNEIYLDTSDPVVEGSFLGIWRLSLDTGSMHALDVGPGGYNSLPLMSPDEKWLLFTGFNDKAVLPTAPFGTPSNMIKVVSLEDYSARVALSRVDDQEFFLQGWVRSVDVPSISAASQASKTDIGTLDVPEATSGFQRPMTNYSNGYVWKSYALYSCGWVYHPGWDYNGAGGCNDDLGEDVQAVANGHVVYRNTSNWGGMVVQHLYQGITVYSQYGHISSGLYSPGENVSKGDHIAELGNVGTDCAHLHWEIRESDHPNPTNGAYWDCNVLKYENQVDNYYEDPQWWVDNHGPYSGGICSIPSLNSPNEDYVHTSSDRTISFDWSPPSNCDPDGYTFRVSTSTNMDIVPGLPDRGERGTSTAHTFDSQWDKTDLYWSVRACKPCDPYTPGPWASPRRFRIEPGEQQDEGVYLCRNTGYNDCMRFTSDAPSLGDAGFGNDDAESVHIVGDWSAVLFEHEYSGARAVINSSVDNLDNTAVKRNEASSLQVRKRNPAYFTLYDLGDWNGESFGSDRDIRDLGHWNFNDRAESIRVASGHEAIVCADADFHGTCGRTDHDVSDLNAVASGLRNGTSSVRVCSGSCPAAPRTPTLSSPGEGDVIPPGSNITFQWSGNGTSYYLEYWGGAQSGNSGWIDSDHWSPGSLSQSGSSYQWHVKAWNGYGESGWSSTRSFTVAEYVFPPAIPSDLSTSTVSQSQINLSWTDNSDNEDGFRIYRNPNYPWGGELVAEVPANVTTYSDAGLPCGADYYYHIRAYNEAGTSRPSPSVMGSTRVCTPELVSPANGSTIDDSTPTFDWHQSGSADTYVIKVANSPGLANPVIEEELQGSPSPPPSEYTPSVALGDGQWYWQVTAQGSGLPVTSEVWSFSVSTATSVQIEYISEHIVQPGQVLSPTVRVHVNSGHLDPARGDHLVNTDDNTFKACSVQPIRDYVSAGSSYTFDAVNDASFAMTAPTDEGSYTSLWRVWADADYASGDAAINIVVDGTPPSLYIFSPVQDSMLNTSDIMVEVSATDGRSGINQVEFFADYDDGTGRTQHILGWDVDGSNGWSISWNATDALDQHVSLAAYAWDNAWNGAWAPDTEFVLDRTTPSSAVSPLNPTHSAPSFTVSWSGDDNLSGIASYDVQYRDGESGTWTDWLIETDLTLASFIGENDHTYYFRCRAYDNAGNQEPYPGGNGDTYTRVSIVCNDTHEPNDSLSQATGISYGQTVNADICPPGDDDYYVFTGSAGDWIVADIDARMNGSELDSYLYLLDNDGSMITSNDDYGGSLDSCLEHTLPHDGTFYLRVREFSDGMEGDANHFYNLSLHHVEEAPYFDDLESGITGWASTGLWHQVNEFTSPYPESHSWSHSWWYGRDATGDYDDGSANMGELTSPPIYIPTEGYYLRFWSWYETETYGALWDGRSVQISVGGGEFEDVLQLASDPMEEWIPISAIDLSPYAGSVIRFRFAFNTIDYMYNNYRGWYVDDFSISTTPPPICSDPHEPNDWTGEAMSISYGDSMDAQVCPQGDLDFYTFNGAAGEKIIVDIDAQVNGSYLDSYVYLLDSDGSTYLAENDDAYGSLDSHLVYDLPHDGTYYIKVRAWNHPSVGGTDHFYTIRLLTDNTSPSAQITLPAHDTWLNPNQQTITTAISDSESGIRNVTFYWHDADWDGSSDWVVLKDDWDTGDGWTYQLDTSSISEQPQDGVVFIYAYDWAGNCAGYGSYHLGIDRTPPTVTAGVSQMFGDAPFRDFWVHWGDSRDNLSSIASYDIQYRDGASGTWTDLVIGTTDTYTCFVGLDSHTYYFRARARDYAGNQSAYAGNNGDAEHTVQTCPVPPDAYEVDDTSSRARWIKPDAPMQIHGFHAEGDQDWVKFYAAAGITYTLTTSNTGGHADTVLYLYDRDGATLIASNDDYPGMWPASRLDWQPSVSGFYWIEVEHWDPWAYGCTAEYGLSIVGSEPTSFSQVYLPLVISNR